MIPHGIGAGSRFGRLTVVRFAGQDRWKKFIWECRCTCGGTRFLISSKLNSGKFDRCVACGYRRDRERHKAARLLVSPDRRREVAMAGGWASARKRAGKKSQSRQ